MNFERFFQLISYAAVFCGFLALWVSGVGVVVTALFLGVMVLAWRLEGSRWQVSEKVGTALIVAALPVFYLLWRFGVIADTNNETWLPGILARMILSLAAVKLLQRKSDRDWIFLYLMSFFEVLLAAGLSISAFYLGSLILYMLVMVCAVIAFEIRKTSRAVENKIAGVVADKKNLVSEAKAVLPARRLPATSITLISFIVLLAVPLFFLLPRVGGAGFGGREKGLETRSGFSDRVTLGGIGRIQQSDEVVMRVKLENTSEADGGLYFRGIALDTFDNKTWSKARPQPINPFAKTDSDLFQFGYATDRENLSRQTIYLEPLDTPVLFGLPRVVGIQGNFEILTRDSYDAITQPQGNERTNYKVVSDRSVPSVTRLRADDQPYSASVQNYLRLPRDYDKRIDELTERVTSRATNRYDRAKVVESHLQNSYGYTLEQRVGDVDEPLAEFLFNVREGHCEYFATAMAVMLRTQGIATRVVNGFHGGEYNETVGMTLVRQRNAHAWVEVYFPGEDAWVTFDPTPFGGEAGLQNTGGIAGTFRRYIDALETFWIQYFVAYDNQEQRSLARSVQSGFSDYQKRIAEFLGVTRDRVAEWLAEVRGDKGLQASLTAIGIGVAYLAGGIVGVLLIGWLMRKLVKLKVWRRLWDRAFARSDSSVIGFYERMQSVLASKGFRREPHQTPLEFAFALAMPEAVKITEKYNRVRFGEKNLSRDEAVEIESWLEELSSTDEHR